jgi:hypothetical protein
MAEILTALNFCKMWDDYNNLAKRLEKLTVQFGELFGNDSSRVDQLFRYASNKEQGGKDALLEFKIEEVFNLYVKKAWGKYDLTAHSKDTLKGLKVRPLDEDAQDFLSENEIMLLTEKDAEGYTDKLIKLVHSRARLKILLTHCANKEIRKELLGNYSRTIAHFNKRYPENKMTEYLLISGKKKNGAVIWKKFMLDNKGAVQMIPNRGRRKTHSK